MTVPGGGVVYLSGEEKRYSGDYEVLDDEDVRYNQQLLTHISKFGLIAVALVWGIFLLLNMIPGVVQNSPANARYNSRAGMGRGITHSGRGETHGSSQARVSIGDGNHGGSRELGAKRKATVPDSTVDVNLINKARVENPAYLIPITLESIKNGTFKPNFREIEWTRPSNGGGIQDNGLYVLLQDNWKYELKSAFDEDFSRLLFEGETIVYEGMEYQVNSLDISPALTHLLIRVNSTQVWRHSSIGSYFIYDIESNTYFLMDKDISFALWSPNGENIAYVRDNDIYICSADNGAIKRVTNDGSETRINGKADWVYEEEVLGGSVALWWSPTGEYLSYLQTDETEVGEFPISYYLKDPESQYPTSLSLRYPKAGTQNPTVNLKVYEVSSASASHVEIYGSQLIVAEVKWVGDTSMLVKVTDRTSNNLKILIVNASNTGDVQTARKEHFEDSWWDITQKTLYVPKNNTNNRNNDGYVDLILVDGYKHLAYYSPPTNPEPIVLTKGEWEVIDGPLAIDYDTNDVYFLSTQKSSMEKHLYSVNLLRPFEIRAVTNTNEEGVYKATFSNGCRFLELDYLGPGVPYQKLIDLKSDITDSPPTGNLIGETLYYLADNAELKEKLGNYDISQKTYRELDLGKDSEGQPILANSFEILPPGFDSKNKNYYPVFFYTYGGPTSQNVIKTFSIEKLHAFATELEAIVVCVDGRGTGGKGSKFSSVVYGNLGDLEAEDQISAARLYAAKPFVNADKISIFGWSYGGYLTLKTLEKDAGQTIKYGMAVAPVTDWKLYDSIYTERYMSTPDENPTGYDSSKVHNMTALAEVPRFLLVHGTGDDNVHFQNTLKLLDEFNLAGMENFDIQVFPDSGHSINFHNANGMVYRRLMNWMSQAYDDYFV